MNWYFRLSAWFFDPIPAQSLIICRIGFGLTLFLFYLTRIPHLQDLYGPAGFGGYEFYQKSGELVSPIPYYDFCIYLFSSPYVVYVFFTVMMFCLLSFAFGARTRTTGCIALFLHACFALRAELSSWGWVIMIQPLMLYTILAPSGRYFSWDSKRFHSHVPVERWTAPAWPLRLIQFNICTMYVKSGWEHLFHPMWQKGVMVYIGLSNRITGRFEIDWSIFKPLLAIPNYYSYLIEAIAPFLLWSKFFGPWIAIGLIGMHALAELLLNVGWWSSVMMVGLATFLPKRWLIGFYRLL